MSIAASPVSSINGMVDLRARVGQKIGVTDWLVIDQDRIDRFGAVTNDMDPMHVDPAWAATNSPFKTTIAFGFLTLSLLTHFLHQAISWRVGASDKGVQFGLNYGLDRVRLLTPVPVNSKIRGHITLKSLEEREAGHILQKYFIEVELEGHPKPALIAEWLVLAVESAAD